MAEERRLEADWNRFQRKLEKNRSEKSKEKPSKADSPASNDSDINRLRDELLDSSYDADVKPKSSNRHEKGSKRSHSRDAERNKDKTDRHRHRSKSPKRSEEKKFRKSPERHGREESDRHYRHRRDDRRDDNYKRHRRGDSPPGSSSRPKGGKVTRQMMIESMIKGTSGVEADLTDGPSEMIISNEKHSDLPLDDSPRQYRGGKRRIAEISERAQQMTGVTVPKYYNQAAVNPLKYAETIQKRKLLWGGKEKQVSSSWQKLLAAAGEDKNAEKFRKLVGFKGDADGSGKLSQAEIAAQQKEMMEKLDIQYEIARMSTHTHRGLGLGFASGSHATSTTAIETPKPSEKL